MSRETLFYEKSAKKMNDIEIIHQSREWLRELEGRQNAIGRKRENGTLPRKVVDTHDRPTPPAGMKMCPQWKGNWLRVTKSNGAVMVPLGCGKIDCIRCGRRTATKATAELIAGYTANWNNDPTELMTITYPALRTDNITKQPETQEQYRRRWEQQTGLPVRVPAKLDEIDWEATPRQISKQVADMDWSYAERTLWILNLPEHQLAKWDTGNHGRLQSRVNAMFRRMFNGQTFTFCWSREWTKQGQLHRHYAYRIPTGFNPRAFPYRAWLARQWKEILGYRDAQWPMQVEWHGRKPMTPRTKESTLRNQIHYIAKYIAKDWNQIRRAPVEPGHSAMRRRGKSNDWGDAVAGDWDAFQTDDGEYDKREYQRAYGRAYYWLQRLEQWADPIKQLGKHGHNIVISWRRQCHYAGLDEDDYARWRFGELVPNMTAGEVLPIMADYFRWRELLEDGRVLNAKVTNDWDKMPEQGRDGVWDKDLAQRWEKTPDDYWRPAVQTKHGLQLVKLEG